MTLTDKEKIEAIQTIDNIVSSYKNNVKVRADSDEWERKNIDKYIDKIKEILED